MFQPRKGRFGFSSESDVFQLTFQKVGEHGHHRAVQPDEPMVSQLANPRTFGTLSM